MEGNTEQLSSRSWIEEYQEWMKERGMDESVLSCLYPSLPDDYFETHPEVVLEKPKPKKPSVMPFIKRVDLNNSEDSPEENKPVYAWEIGIKVDF